MNSIRLSTRKIGMAAAVVALGLFALPAGAQTVRYKALPTGSQVKMEGTSTIHDWSMESPIIAGFMDVDPGFPESALKDPNAAKPKAEAFMLVRTFKSYSKRMDEVMQEHMNMAKYPRMVYRLIELKPKPDSGTNGALHFDAVGTLTISGTTRTNTMPVTIEKVNQDQIKVTGSTPLKMSDFGVKPPAPSILGMPLIKTGDEIKITFTWLTQKAAAKN